MVVVSDTSPIIVLHKAELLNILRQLFKIIYIPPAVFSELTQKASENRLKSSVNNCSFIHVKPLEIPIPSLEHKLDIGEIEALALSRQMNADLLILDDKRAQKEASLLSISYVSTFTLLIKAHQMKFVKDLKQVLEHLEKQNIYLSKDLQQYKRIWKSQ